MKDLIQKLRRAAELRARYRRTRDEIANMSPAEALDLGIYRGDAERMARMAVYGR